MTEQKQATGHDTKETREIGGVGGAGDQVGGATEDREGERRARSVVAQ